MRRLVAVLACVALLASPTLALQLDRVDLEVNHTVLGPAAEPTRTFEPGTGGQIQIEVTNRDDRTINVTFSLAPLNETGALNRSTGEIQSNATSEPVLIPIFVAPRTPEGVQNVTVHGSVDVRQDGNWTHARNLSFNATVEVVVPTRPPRFPVVPAVLVAVAAGLGGTALYLKLRQPSRTLPPEPTEEERREGRRQRQQSIVEAKRQDLRDAIERARERLDEGEITEYQFERIKEQKESQLEDLEGDDDA